MIKPDQSILRAIKNLETNVSWQEIVVWLNDSLISQAMKNLNLSGEEAIRGQGRGQELAEIVKIITKTPEYLDTRKK